MIDTVEVEARLRRTFDAVAATTRVEAPRRRPRQHRDRRPTTSRLVPAVSLLAAAVAIVLILLVGGRGGTPTHVRTRPADSTASSLPGLKARPGMMAVSSEDGVPVGYVHLSDIHPSLKDYAKKVNARTLWPVTDVNDVLVGYLAPDIPFIPLSVVNAPGFDIERVRAERNGGCEEQIGDPNFKQEFPLCPVTIEPDK